jgi:hypothetical protein
MDYDVPKNIKTKADARRYLAGKRNLKPNRVKKLRSEAPGSIRWPWPTNGFVNAPMGLSVGLPVRTSAANKFSCASRKDLGQVLGRGRQGIVFKCRGGAAAKICPHDFAAEARREPQPVAVEFANQKAAAAAAPNGVVKVYDRVYCENFV